MVNVQEKNYERSICKFIDPDKKPITLLDIGVGLKSEYITLLKEYPDMASIGLEPCPMTFKTLVPKFPGLLLPYAVWKEPTNLDLYFSKSNLNAASVFAIGRDENVKVHARTLDSIDRQLGFPDRILLWIDVEGAELMALQGAIKLLGSGRVRWINIAVRNKWSDNVNASTREEVHQLLTKFGYQEKLQYNHHNRQSEFWRCDAIYVRENYLKESN
jgi:FkbM family methyltransferase